MFHQPTRSLWRLLPLALALILAACGGAPQAGAPAPAPEPTSAPAAEAATAAPAAPTVAPTAAPAAPTEPLRIAIVGDEGTLTPYTYQTGYPGWNMLNLVYDTLLILDANNLPQPWLAASYTISEDGLTHTLTLRDDVTWHDGEQLTSEDVKFSYEFYKANRQSRWTPPMGVIESIEAPDATTVVMTLTNASPAFALQPLADVPIIPQHLWEGAADPKAVEGAVGSGPYLLAEYAPEQFYRFTANPNYFAGAPTVPEIVMPIISEANTIFAALRSGEIDSTVRSVPPELVADFEGNADLAVQKGPGYATLLLQFNTERAPWNKTAVRQAISRAVNRQQLIDTILLGQGTIGNPGWFHPASPVHQLTSAPAFDLAAAQAILDAAGYTDGDGDGVREADGAPLTGELLVYANNPIRLRSAELIAAGLEPLGVRLEVTALDPDSVDAKVWPEFDVAKGRDFDLAIWNWSAPTQINPLRAVGLVHSDPTIGTLNIGGFKNAEADRIADAWRVTVDEAEQRKLAGELEALIAAELPFATLLYEDGNYAFRTAAFQGWTYQKGQGIFSKLSFVNGPRP